MASSLTLIHLLFTYISTPPLTMRPGLAVYCLNPSCRHRAVFSADDYPDEMPVPSFQTRLKCSKCGAKGRQLDVRPNWKEQPTQSRLTGKIWR